VGFVAPSASDGVVAVDVMADDGSEALLLLPLPLLPLLPPPPLPPPPPPQARTPDRSRGAPSSPPPISQAAQSPARTAPRPKEE
jgi:hypothetical protein